MVGDGGDCCVGSKTVITTYFSVTGGGSKLAWPLSTFHTKIEFEFDMYNNHHTPAFEASMATRSAPVP
eukprot:scaffold155622_cov77-Cyclotella_meneghiniana.AAC.3